MPDLSFANSSLSYTKSDVHDSSMTLNGVVKLVLFENRATDILFCHSNVQDSYEKSNVNNASTSSVMDIKLISSWARGGQEKVTHCKKLFSL